jgi:hypothetical protein
MADDVLCTVRTGWICGIGRKRDSIAWPCGKPSVSVYVRVSDGKRVGRCAEHDTVDLTQFPQNAGWKKEAADANRSA